MRDKEKNDSRLTGQHSVIEHTQRSRHVSVDDLSISILGGKCSRTSCASGDTSAPYDRSLMPVFRYKVFLTDGTWERKRISMWGDVVRAYSSDPFEDFKVIRDGVMESRGRYQPSYPRRRISSLSNIVLPPILSWWVARPESLMGKGLSRPFARLCFAKRVYFHVCFVPQHITSSSALHAKEDETEG